jgi:type IV secretory pathway VirB3-like protein
MKILVVVQEIINHVVLDNVILIVVERIILVKTRNALKILRHSMESCASSRNHAGEYKM